MNTDSEKEIYEALREALPFFDGLSDSDRAMLVRTSQRVCFEAGTTVHDGGECTGIILVKRGMIRIYMLSEDGKEVTLFRLYSGDLCIFSASCALSALTFDVSVDSEWDSECIVVGGCAVERITEKVPEAKIFVLEEALAAFSDIMWVMQQILFMSMDKRLAIFLLEELSKSKSDTVLLTHEQIAKYMGSAREVVSRMLKYFASEGLVQSKRNEGIKILDKARIRKIAGM